MYLRAEVSIQTTGDVEAAFVRNLGHAMLNEYEVQIGGSRIDRQTGDFMNFNQSLGLDSNKKDAYDKMIGNVPELTELRRHEGKTVYQMYIPLNFWFCKNVGLSLPMIALQYHDVRVQFNFRDADKLVVTNGMSGTVTAKVENANLLTDYVFLDADERKAFATTTHEFLIEQLQSPDEDPITSSSKKVRMVFNHPCKYLAWGVKMGKFTEGKKFLAYHPTDMKFVKRRTAELVYLLSLKLEGVETDASGAITTVRISSDDSGAYETSGTPSGDIATFLKEIEGTAMVIAKASENGDGSFDLPGSFVKDPFASVEFVDESYMESASLQKIMNTSWDPSDLKGKFSGNDIVDTLLSYMVSVRMYDNYGVNFDGSANPVFDGNIQINGQDRFSKRDGNYFNYVQPYQHFYSTPSDGMNVYSFALKPLEHQPSGTCNFSRIDFAQLSLSLTKDASDVVKDQESTSNIIVYTVNYNVLRVMGGMGGVAYAN
jgi:hypothetical protein